mmetsp:Transcript_5545/g.14031  ORF Transcript_5545/g.14031 Transcript_5545/m.14031 type:complete len:233 (-) Transcript_5545:144-842(-)
MTWGVWFLGSTAHLSSARLTEMRPVCRPKTSLLELSHSLSSVDAASTTASVSSQILSSLKSALARSEAFSVITTAQVLSPAMRLLIDAQLPSTTTFLGPTVQHSLMTAFNTPSLTMRGVTSCSWHSSASPSIVCSITLARCGEDSTSASALAQSTRSFRRYRRVSPSRQRRRIASTQSSSRDSSVRKPVAATSMSAPPICRTRLRFSGPFCTRSLSSEMNIWYTSTVRSILV